MTAAIVMHASRAPFPADLAARVADEQAESLGIPSVSIAGDANVTAQIPRPAGTLWERVAELSATGLNYTERMERVKFDRIVSAAGRLSREAESRHYMRGPDAKYAPAHRSGVIESGTRRPNNVRAGERIK